MRALLILVTLLFMAGCMEPSEWRQPFPDGDDGGDPDPDDGGGGGVAPVDDGDTRPDDPAPDDSVPDDSVPDDGTPDDDEPPSRPTDDDDSTPDDGPDESPDVEPVDDGDLPDDEPAPTGGDVEPGGACACDSDCSGTTTHPGLCIHGVCGARATSDTCAPGSSAECPEGHRCWSGTGIGICYPDVAAFTCSGRADRDGSCVADGVDCYAVCGEVCGLSGDPGEDGVPGDCDGDSGGGGGGG